MVNSLADNEFGVVYLSHVIGLLGDIDGGDMCLSSHNVLDAGLRSRGFPHTVQRRLLTQVHGRQVLTQLRTAHTIWNLQPEKSVNSPKPLVPITSLDWWQEIFVTRGIFSLITHVNTYMYIQYVHSILEMQIYLTWPKTSRIDGNHNAPSNIDFPSKNC